MNNCKELIIFKEQLKAKWKNKTNLLNCHTKTYCQNSFKMSTLQLVLNIVPIYSEVVEIKIHESSVYFCN